MGALHRGHIELIRVAREAAGKNGAVAVSIFVNPLQFEPGSDYDKYPRPESRDEELCSKAGVDVLFRPAVAEMYPDDRSVWVDETQLSQTLCGRSRPGHFRGVCTVLTKLFNIFAPEAAVFGEKDFQQLAIIRRMVRDLNFKLEVIGVPTVREQDGLAVSSRNQYLNEREREEAAMLHASLQSAAQTVREGCRSAVDILAHVRAQLNRSSLARIDYVELVDAETLQPVSQATPGCLVALAVFFGKTRLIDNIRLP
jgi:pantoate--beta-alanine ligase